jgi:hypothetical protein
MRPDHVEVQVGRDDRPAARGCPETNAAEPIKPISSADHKAHQHVLARSRLASAAVAARTAAGARGVVVSPHVRLPA